MSAQNKQHTLLSDYLNCLGVPFTDGYTRRRMVSMPFQTLFGISKVLEDYGVESEGYRLGNVDEIRSLTPPFVARTAGGLVIVTSMDDRTITYITQGQTESMPLDEFKKAWCGVVMLSFPDADASEPDFADHRRMEILQSAKSWVLALCAMVMLLYLIVSRGLYMHWSTIGLIAVDSFGLYLSYLLVQKSLKIHNPTADRVCGVLEKGGCDSILALKASKFFGLFGWSEVGLRISRSASAHCCFCLTLCPGSPSVISVVCRSPSGVYGISASGQSGGVRSASACSARYGCCFSATSLADGYAWHGRRRGDL